MNIRLFPLFTGLLLLTLTACAPGGSPTPPASTAAAIRPPDALALPGANIQTGQELSISYPPASLYQPGAALPSATGLAQLEALAKWLNGQPSGRWQASLNVAPETAGELALPLAQQRQQLLQQFLARQGVDEASIVWQVQAGAGPELELKALNGPS